MRRLMVIGASLVAMAVSAGNAAADPVQSTSVSVQGPTEGAGGLLTTCPTFPIPIGQRCTDTQISVLTPASARDPSATPGMGIFQVTYDWTANGPRLVSGFFGSGEASVTVGNRLRSANGSATFSVRACDGNLNCAPAGPITLTASWNATGAVTRFLPERLFLGSLLIVGAGYRQDRAASMTAAIDGVAVPGTVRGTTTIFRSNSVRVCVSVIPDAC